MTVCGSRDYNCRSCWGCTAPQVAAGQCVLPPNPVLVNASTCDPMGADGAHAMYKWTSITASPPPPVAPPPAAPPPAPVFYERPLSGTNAAWYSAGAFLIDPAVLGSADGSIPSTLGAVWTPLNCGWVFRCTSATSGCMPCTGPYIYASSESSALANVAACQTFAGNYGFDTVWVSGYHYRPSCGVYSLDCWACKGCAYWAGGSVPAAATCTTIGTNRTGCSPLGCDACYDTSGAQLPRPMQIYKKLPAAAAFAPFPPPPPLPPPSPSPPPAPPPSPPAPPPMLCAAYTASGGSFASTCTISGVPVGYVIRVGTRTVVGATCSGDTYLKLVAPTGGIIATNDDYISLCSFMQVTAPAAGTYTVQQGCYSTLSCGGTVAYTITAS